MNEKIGLDFIFNTLDIVSSLGRDTLKSRVFSKDKDYLIKEYDILDYTLNLIEKKPKIYSELKRKLLNLKDITSILKRLENGYILDDVDFFEIKRFSMISQNIFNLLQEETKILSPENLETVIDLLDPDKIRIESFYIYSSYSIELSLIRKELKETKNEELYEKEMKLESKIRERLGKKILDKIGLLKETVKKLGYLDFVLGKAKQSIELNLKRPIISNETNIKGMFHPKISETLKEKNKTYQKVDICLNNNVTIITGANMSGKTVTLRTLALIQKMAQIGFFIPVDRGELSLVDDVLISIGDSQSLEEGLSSFAGEILNINRIIKKAKTENKYLILIDELARTTNPQEGRALLKSIGDILLKYSQSSVITTHYSGVGNKFNMLRVKGIKKDLNENLINIKNIEEYIDYSLIPVKNDEIPEEALTIARILKVDDEIINGAYEYL